MKPGLMQHLKKIAQLEETNQKLSTTLENEKAAIANTLHEKKLNFKSLHQALQEVSNHPGGERFTSATHYHMVALIAKTKAVQVDLDYEQKTLALIEQQLSVLSKRQNQLALIKTQPLSSEANSSILALDSELLHLAQQRINLNQLTNLTHEQHEYQKNILKFDNELEKNVALLKEVKLKIAKLESTIAISDHQPAKTNAKGSPASANTNSALHHYDKVRQPNNQANLNTQKISYKDKKP